MQASHLYDFSPGSRLVRNRGLKRDRKQHTGILLLNISWQSNTGCFGDRHERGGRDGKGAWGLFRGMDMFITLIAVVVSWVYTCKNLSSCRVCVHVHAKLLQSRQTLCNSMDYSSPGSSVHGILQAVILEWVAMPSSRDSSWPRDWTRVSYVSCIGRQVLCH